MANGGMRPGAGRKPGVPNRPQLCDMLPQEQIDALVAKGIQNVDAHESLMFKFMLAQIRQRDAAINQATRAEMIGKTRPRGKLLPEQIS
jgi:hypothetical protein